MQYISRIVGLSDNTLFYFVNRKFRCQALDSFMPLVTNLGGAVFTVLCCLILLALGTGDIKLAAMRASLSLIGSFVIGFFLKKLFTRPRPYLVLPGAVTGSKLFRDYSFPSGHTTAAFSLAVSYMVVFQYLCVPLFSCALLVGISRIYLGQHYPSDVLAGSALGTISALLTSVVF